MTEQPKNYVVSDNVLYEEINKGLYTSFKKYNLPVLKTASPRWTGPKIPFKLWQEMAAWCQITQAKLKSEALVFLFLDTTKNEWKAWYLPQVTNGMTVSADEDHKDYTEQRKAFPDLQFGSLHHHCNVNAFASSVDKADEEDREGLHFTLGNIGAKVHSVHYRFCIEGACYEGDAHEVIDYHEDIAKVPAKYRDKIHKEMIIEPVEGWEEKDFEKELKNIRKPVSGNPVKKTQASYTPIGGRIQTTSPVEERTTVTEILDFIETDISLTVDIGEVITECGYTADYNLAEDFQRILKLWDKTYKSKAAKAKRDELLSDVAWTLTIVPYIDHDWKLIQTVKSAIKTWLAEYNNE